MASKSLRQQALSALNKLHAQAPNEHELNVLFDQLRNEPNDRSVALLAACIVDDVLAIAISTSLRKLNSDEWDRLFGPEQPLSTFSAKIRMAYALELLDRKRQQNLDSIRAIRNAFAHVTRHLAFKDLFVSAVCDHLHTHLHFGKGPENARPRFIWAAMDAISTLADMALPKLYPDGLPEPPS